jgi:hypothetical protein
MKIETPEEFAQIIKNNDLKEAARIIALRDAAIRKTCTNKLWDKLIKLFCVGEKI